MVSRKLADDLGLQVGSQAVLEHPHRMAVVVVRRIETEVVVSGIHDNPVRGLAYVDRGQRPFTGFEDATNLLSVVPAPGVDHDTLRRALFGEPGIASAEPVRQIIAGFDEVIAMLGGILAVVQVAVIALAFLIAFNATSIYWCCRAGCVASTSRARCGSWSRGARPSSGRRERGRRRGPGMLPSRVLEAVR